MADRGRGIPVAVALEADQREIAGPAAKIADQNQRIGGEALGVVIGGADRLVDIGRIKDADTATGFAVALDRQRLVRCGTDKGDRPPHNYTAARFEELVVGIGDRMSEKRRQQILEFVGAAKDAGLVKKRARDMAL